MNEQDEILRKLSEMQTRIKSLTVSDKSYISEIYPRILRREFKKTNCSDCYGDAVILLILNLKKNTIMPKSNYQLKNGVVLQSASFAEVITNANITDKLAEKFLKENPKRLSFFAVYPSKWDEKTGDWSQTTDSKTSKDANTSKTSDVGKAPENPQP